MTNILPLPSLSCSRPFKAPGRSKAVAKPVVAAPSSSPTSPNSCPSAKLASARRGCAETSSSRSSMVFVGIDVSKLRLDVHVRASGEEWSVDNDAKGHAQLVSKLAALVPTLVLLEATGGYQAAIAAELAAGNVPVAVAQTLDKFGTSRRRRESSPRPTRSTPRCSRTSPRLSDPNHAPFPTSHARAPGARHSSTAAHRHAHRRD